MMKYERPSIEIIEFEEREVIKTSLTNNGTGNGSDDGGFGFEDLV